VVELVGDERAGDRAARVVVDGDLAHDDRLAALDDRAGRDEIAALGAVEIVEAEPDRRAARSARQLGPRPRGGGRRDVDERANRPAVHELADRRDLRPEGEAHAHAVVGGVDELHAEQAAERRTHDRVS